ncbi:MAG TPA: nitric oxide synthase oxygenase [Pilimelia sp.]|nr:nitric oxide synthase oxygenase [Pilimelia sp.]
MSVPGYRDIPTPSWDPATPVDPAEAEDFLRRAYAENPRWGPVEPRLAVVRTQLDVTGIYTHTPDELTYGAKLAWRNASRCIGRLYWRSLVVLDRRRARTGEEIFNLVLRHLAIAGGAVPPDRVPGTGRVPAGPPAAGPPARGPACGAAPVGSDCGDADRAAGAIRPVISIFAPAVPGRPYARIWNEQLIRYAGYRTERGDLIGDPRYLEFTAAMRALGWRGRGAPFDVLPLAIETPEEGVRLFELPERAVLEVPLAHPDYPWFAELGLRWHAVPAIANMRLTIGGINYPLAPFNGWYLGTEIGARNLADTDRYNMLPVVAQMLGLDTSHEASLWRDRALVELNRAVLWSFQRAGVKITDHHTESQRFLAHVRTEGRAGREVPADWTWIVPPMSGGVTGVFHRYYAEADLRPNFYLDEEALFLGRLGRRPPRPPVPRRPSVTLAAAPARAGDPAACPVAVS